MIAPTGSVKIQFFFHMYMERQFFMFSRDSTHLSDFLILVLLSFYPLRYVLAFVPKIEQEKEEPVSISFLSHKLCFPVHEGKSPNLSSFYVHLACSLDLSKAELML